MLEEHSQLLNLLMARCFRIRANNIILIAISLEKLEDIPHKESIINDAINRAAHYEWFAGRLESGRVMFIETTLTDVLESD